MSAGFRSLAAPWAGGASANQSQAGFRSLFAFWMGGAAALAATVPTPPTVFYINEAPRQSRSVLGQQLAEDDLILAVLIQGPFL